MYDEPVPFNRGAIRPMQCLSEGWALIKTNYWLFVGIAFVGTLIAGAGPLGILAGPMMCGMYLCIFECTRGREVSFNLLFKGFEYFAPCIVPALIMTGITFVLVFAGYLVFMVGAFATIGLMAPQQRGQEPGPAFFGVIIGLYGGFFLYLMVVILTLRTIFFFAFPLVMDRGLTGWEAVKLSARASWANLGGVIGILLLIELLGLVCSLLCCVGPILELPLNVALLALAYRQVFPDRDPLARFDDRDDVDDRAPLAALAGETGIQSEEPERTG